MSLPGPGRTLASLVHDEAPLPTRRAAAVMVAVSGELARLETRGTGVTDLDARDVELRADGSVRITPSGAVDGVGAGAGVGRLLFELLVGRPPLDSQDAFEPHLTDTLASTTVSLLARSASDAPGQWPSVEDWRRELDLVAGGQAPPDPPPVTSARRRRRVALAIALVVLVSVTTLVLALAPSWWDDANQEGLGAAADAQALDRS